MKRPRFFQVAEVDGCRVLVDLIDSTGERKSRRLAWRSDRGPFSSSGKVEADEEYYIPVAVKSDLESGTLGAVNGQYILRRKAAYVVDAAGLIHGNDTDTESSYQRDSLPPGTYTVKVQIKKGLKRLDRGCDTFTLVVPRDLNDLDGFKLLLISGQQHTITPLPLRP